MHAYPSKFGVDRPIRGHNIGKQITWDRHVGLRRDPILLEVSRNREAEKQ